MDLSEGEDSQSALEDSKTLDDQKSIEEIVQSHAENDYPSGRHIYQMKTDNGKSKLLAMKIKLQVYLG